MKFREWLDRKKELRKIRIGTNERLIGNEYISKLDWQLLEFIQTEIPNYLFVGERHSLLFSLNPKERAVIIGRYVKDKNGGYHLGTNTSLERNSERVYLSLLIGKDGIEEKRPTLDKTYSLMEKVFIGLQEIEKGDCEEEGS